MLSRKHAAGAALLVFVFAPAALAQDRSDEPTDELSPSGRTTEPVPYGKKPPRARAADSGDQPDGQATAPRPAAASAEKDGAPWSWPWTGAVRSPGFTQDESFVRTGFWLMDVGHVQLETVFDGVVARRSYDVDQLYQAKARIGLLPHIELSISEDATLLTHDHLRQEGNEIGARVAFWDYGQIPLNPSFEIVWHPRHDGADGYAARGMVGMELFPHLLVVGNAFFEGETGGSHDYTWGFRGGVAYELIHDVLRAGCEGGVSWHWNKDHDRTPFRDTAPSVGPTVLLRPLALIRPEWGHWVKLTVSCEFGIRDDNVNVPFMRGGVLLACSF